MKVEYPTFAGWSIFFPKVPGYTYDHLIVHCTATSVSHDTSAADVHRMHRQRGWSGNGYNAVIRRDGTLEHNLRTTRPYGRPGSHVGGCGPGWNRRSIGVSLAGGVEADGKTPEDNFTPEQMETLWYFVRAAMEHWNIPKENVIGHRDLIKMTKSSPKACPCFSVRHWMGGHDMTKTRLNFEVDTSRRPSSDANVLRVNKTYTVKNGDTLWSISNKFGVPLDDLRKHNMNVTDSVIYPGQRLRLWY